MLVSEYNKLIFVKNKRSGSHSATKLLKTSAWFTEVASWHSFASEVYNVRQKKKDGWSIVCCVRDPWDRTISSYEYLKDAFSIDMNGRTFQQWVLDPDLKFEACHPRADECNVVIRFENIKEELAILAKSVGITPTRIPRLNFRNRRQPWSAYYTSSQIIDRVAQMYPGDIERYGYEYRTRG